VVESISEMEALVKEDGEPQARSGTAGNSFPAAISERSTEYAVSTRKPESVLF
jgi:hypothetical protein